MAKFIDIHAKGCEQYYLVNMDKIDYVEPYGENKVKVGKFLLTFESAEEGFDYMVWLAYILIDGGTREQDVEILNIEEIK